MDLTKLTYHKEVYPLKNMGALISYGGDELLSHLFDQRTFDTYIKKYIDQDDDYTYYVLFRTGYVGFISFFNKTRSLRQWFLICKDYCIVRDKNSDGSIELTDAFKDHEGREEFADEYGPLKGSFYDEDIATDYAKQFAKSIIKE